MNYTREDIHRALSEIGIKRGDIIFSHVSLGLLGRAEGCSTMEELSRFWLSSILDYIGPEGTFLVPTYTYSACKGQLYEVDNTASTIGEFTDLFRKDPRALRSMDPIFSVAGIGPATREIIDDLPRNCFGMDCVYHRLVQKGAKLCMIGVALDWATFLHHTEQSVPVPFRFKKLFIGPVKHGEKVDREGWIYNVRILSDNGYPNATRLYKKLREQGICQAARVGRGEIQSIGCREYFEHGVSNLRADSFFTARGPACDPIEVERARVKCFEPERPEIISDIFKNKLEKLEKDFALKIHRYKSGTEKFGWIVPERWAAQEIELLDASGQKIPLSLSHISSYSLSFEGKISGEELEKRKEGSTPEFQYYARTWKLRGDLPKFSDTEYQLKLKTAFAFDELCVGEIQIAGRNEENILLECPLLALNQDILEFISDLKNRKPKFSYRILFTPETIGTVIYLGIETPKLRNESASFYKDWRTLVGHKIKSRRGTREFVSARWNEAPYDWTKNFQTQLDLAEQEQLKRAPDVVYPVFSARDLNSKKALEAWFMAMEGNSSGI